MEFRRKVTGERDRLTLMYEMNLNDSRRMETLYGTNQMQEKHL